MPCYHPIQGWRSKKVNESGKRSIVFNPREGYLDMPVTIPCGQCIGCRLEKSRQWAMRIMLEASLYEDNCFITLTYDEVNLPDPPSLQLEDFQLFMKRLRKQYGSGIRFFHCGEYGEQGGRPHYHAILLNFDFPDKQPMKLLDYGKDKNKLYTSESLERIWPYGHSSIGSVTFQSAGYVARYVTKKITGTLADEHYQRIDYLTGEVVHLKPEYSTMSRRPGIGKPWYDRYKSDVFPSDYLVVNGRKVKPPKFFETLLELDDEKALKAIKGRRIESAKTRLADSTPERLEVREIVKEAQIKNLKRNKL
jgi:hypothetical protein